MLEAWPDQESTTPTLKTITKFIEVKGLKRWLFQLALKQMFYERFKLAFEMIKHHRGNVKRWALQDHKFRARQYDKRAYKSAFIICAIGYDRGNVAI